MAAYREFLTLYPSHPQADFAQFQVAEAYFKQKNSPDRDQTSTEKALGEYERLLDLYPASSQVERRAPADPRLPAEPGPLGVPGRLLLPEDAARPAGPRSSATRAILNDYPDYERLDEVLFRLAECLDAAGRRAEALPHLARLLGEYPKSGYAGECPEAARTELLSTAGAAPPVSLPGPTGDTTAPLPKPILSRHLRICERPSYKQSLSC